MKHSYARNVMYKIDEEHQSLNTGESVCIYPWKQTRTGEQKGQLTISILIIENEAAIFS